MFVFCEISQKFHLWSALIGQSASVYKHQTKRRLRRRCWLSKVYFQCERGRRVDRIRFRGNTLYSAAERWHAERLAENANRLLGAAMINYRNRATQDSDCSVPSLPAMVHRIPMSSVDGNWPHRKINSAATN